MPVKKLRRYSFPRWKTRKETKTLKMQLETKLTVKKENTGRKKSKREKKKGL